MPRRSRLMPLQIDRLRAIREKRGLTQRELARRCGFGETQIYRYENGRGDPSSDHLARIARELRVSTDYLVGISENETGQLSENTLSPEEQIYVDLYRSGGFDAVSAYVLERLTQQLRERGDIP
jgi:transcriptional regulator with XRE-family HTH domain